MTTFRNTPARPAFDRRESPELLEDLCVALRNVAVGEAYVQGSKDAQARIREVVAIAEELGRRGVSTSERLAALSQETGWLMDLLLLECAAFPPVVPQVRELRPGQLIFHSDRGAEYTSAGFGDHLAALGMLQSTTRGGAPEDNPHAEWFFHSLKAEVVHGTRFDSEQSLRAALEEYVPYYNCKRLHSSLGYRPPAEFEAQIGQK